MHFNSEFFKIFNEFSHFFKVIKNPALVIKTEKDKKIILIRLDGHKQNNVEVIRS